MARARLAVWKFASCDGCQLSILDCEDELLQIAAAVDIVHFLEATSHVEPGPYDLSIVEGSVTTPKDAARIQEIREVSKKLVTIGACATAGGIQALRNFGDHAEMMSVLEKLMEGVAGPAAAFSVADVWVRGAVMLGAAPFGVDFEQRRDFGVELGGVGAAVAEAVGGMMRHHDAAAAFGKGLQLGQVFN